MLDTPTASLRGIDSELITTSILNAANMQAAVAKPGTKIEIPHNYENPIVHDDTVRMLLTVKVRASEYSKLRYISSALGIHTLLVT